MINNVVLVGRLTRKPELKQTPQGVAVATFSIAVSRNYTNQNGERETDFINIVAWRRQAENIAKYLDKGSLVGIQGSIRTRSYDGQDGTRRYVTEIIADNVTFLESRNPNSQSNTFQDNNVMQEFTNPTQQAQSNGHNNTNQRVEQSNNYNQNNENDFMESFDLTDDDLPF
jgi:single-strand DNA-binding protein